MTASDLHTPPRRALRLPGSVAARGVRGLRTRVVPSAPPDAANSRPNPRSSVTADRRSLVTTPCHPAPVKARRHRITARDSRCPTRFARLDRQHAALVFVVQVDGDLAHVVDQQDDADLAERFLLYGVDGAELAEFE